MKSFYFYSMKIDEGIFILVFFLTIFLLFVFALPLKMKNKQIS